MIEIERGSGNVYADLQVPNAEAMLLKAQLAAKKRSLSPVAGASSKRLLCSV